MFLKIYKDLYKCSIESITIALQSVDAWKELLDNVDIYELMRPLRWVDEMNRDYNGFG